MKMNKLFKTYTYSGIDKYIILLIWMIIIQLFFSIAFFGHARAEPNSEWKISEHVHLSSMISSNPITGGTYTIDPSEAGDYVDISDAVYSMSVRGISGPVIFKIKSWTYNEQVTIPQISGASSTNTIIFESFSGNKNDVIITYTSNNSAKNYTIKFDGADYVTFRNVTIKSAGQTYGRVIHFSNNSDYNTLYNVNIFGKRNANTSDRFSNIYSYQNSSYNTISNSYIYGGSVGINFIGTSASNKEMGTVIDGNVIDSFSKLGINLKYQKACNVRNNTIHVDNSTGLASVGGLLFEYSDSILDVTANEIILESDSSHFGLMISNSNGHSGNYSNIANNMISLKSTNAQSNPVGIQSYLCYYHNIYHNTVNLYGNNSVSRSFYHLSGGGMNVKNNILNNNAGGFAIMYLTGSGTIANDYNALYSSGSYTAANSLGSSGYFNDLSSWQTASQDAGHSVFAKAEFTSNTDLHINTSNSSAAYFDGSATWVSISTDYDGDSRNTTSPDIGADEFNVSAGITSQPDSQSLSVGDTAYFVISALGSGLSFNWQKNGSSISGANNDTFIIYGVQSSNVGNYRCIVSNTYGSDTSDIAYLNVLTLDSGLVANYLFTGNTGDSSGNGLHGTNVGAVLTTDRFGQTNEAYRFDGTDDYILLSSDSSMMLTNWTFTGWFSVDTFSRSVEMRVIHKDDNSSSRYNFSVGVNQSQQVFGSYEQCSSDFDYKCIADSTLSVGNWYFFAYTNYGDGVSQIYVDEELLNTLTTSKIPCDYLSNVRIGGRKSTSGLVDFFNGRIDDIRIYNRVLTQYEISQLYGNYDHYLEITSQPNSASAYLADTVQFVIEAYGANLTYQWQKNGSDIVGETNDTLIIYGVQESDAGNYTCIVSNSNVKDTSSVATLTVKGPMSGVYTIGQSGTEDFNSFNTAVYDLQIRGVDSSVVFRIGSGTYNEQIVIPEIYGTSSSYTVSFQSGTNDSSDVILKHSSTHTDSNYTIKLDGADYIIFKYITVEASDTTYGTAIEITNDANQNKFQHNYIIGPDVTAHSMELAVVDAYNSYNNDSNYFGYNYIKNGGYAINWKAASSSSLEYGNNFEGNYVKGFFRLGIILYYQYNPVIYNNTIEADKNGSPAYCVYLGGCEKGVIERNQIYSNISNSVYGIYLSACSGNESGLIANNFVSLVSGSGNLIPVYLINSDKQNIYHNTLANNSSSLSTLVLNNADTINLKNNILVNNGTGTTFDFQSTSEGLNSDYNNFYSGGTNIGKYYGNYYSSLSAYQSASSLDQNSISIAPVFVSGNDLHTSSPDLNNAGTNVSITVDIDGENRSTTSPDIGADEFTPPVFISSNPDSVTLSAGDTTTLLIVAEGTSIQYQWQKNGVDISGATSNTYNINGVSSSDVGSYRCYAWNTFGSDTSKYAYLSVLTVDSGIVGYYPFTGNARDSSGNANHGLNNGADLINDRFGDNNKAYSFTNTDYIRISNSPSFNLDTQITIAFWLLNQHKPNHDLIEKLNQGLGTGFDFEVANNNLRIILGRDTINTTKQLSSFNWYYILFTLKGSKYYLYIDNQLIKEGHATYSGLSNTNRLIFGNSYHEGEGGSTETTFGSEFYLDDIITYDRYLNAYQAGQLYDPNPIPIFVYEPQGTGLCPGDTINMKAIASGNSVTYQWYRNGTALSGKTDTSLFITNVQISDTGTYYCIASNSNGSDTSSMVTINIDNPVASFSVNDSQQCYSENIFVFMNNSTGAVNYSWSMGDESSYDSFGISYSYTYTGNYQVILTATSNLGCQDTVSAVVELNGDPSVGFSINDSTQCLDGNSFSFENKSEGATNVTWDFGNGVTSNSYDAAYNYGTAGTYSVKLTGTTAKGCSKSVIKNVTVYEQALADFVVNDSGQCLINNNFSFTNNSSGATGYEWSFGDESGAESTSPAKTYESSGTYLVKLIATNSNNCPDTFESYVVVYDHPKTGFNINDTDQCLAGNSFDFTNLTTGASNYSWSFGDGNSSTNNSPTKTYDSAATYQVSLVASSIYHCNDTLTKSIVVYDQPVAGFNIDDSEQCFGGNRFVFTNNSSDADSFAWHTGDELVFDSTNLIYSYISSGIYIVLLYAVNANGCWDSISKKVTVNEEPLVNFSINDSTQCLSGNTFNFENNSEGASSYNWSLGDGNIKTSTDAIHNYTGAGTYSVRLLGTTSKGCSDSVIRKVYAYAQPVASFSVNDSGQCLSGNSFVFTNTSTGADTYFWTMGDGNTKGSASPTHNYSLANTYNVELFATSSDNCVDSVDVDITVHAQPIAGFSVNDSGQCLSGNNFVFTNTSTGADAYFWTMGDGNTKEATSPTHNYSSANTYNVELFATSSDNCVDSVDVDITVHAQPVAGFSVNDSGQCLSGNSFVFTNTSTGADTYFWTMGDGDTKGSASPTHNYDSARTYNVELFATSSDNCIDSANVDITVYTQPVAGFTVNDSGQCLSGNSFVFTNSSTGANTYFWTMGDGNTKGSASPTHNYSSANNYSVELFATSSDNCIDSANVDITVHAQPVAGFNVNDSGQCLSGNSFVFTNTSTGSDTYFWTMGDGNTKGSVSPTHNYDSARTYNVELFATSSDNCIDSANVDITVYTQPVAGFTINDSDQCLTGNEFIFTNTSSNAESNIWSFGDNNTETSYHTLHNYSLANSFTVSLYTITSDDCSDSAFRTVYVYPHPVASFSVDDSSVCISSAIVNFTNTSTNGNTYSWSFGDNFSDTSFNTTHRYFNTRSYNSRLIAFTENNCPDTATRKIFVNDLPSLITLSPVMNLTDTSAVVFGKITDSAGLFMDNKGVCFKLNTLYGDPTTADSVSYYGSSFSDTFSTSLNVQPETQYKARSFGIGDDCVGYGNTVVFYSLSKEPKSHAGSFEASTISGNQILLDFSSAGNIQDCDGYMIIRSEDSITNIHPVDGQSYSQGQLGTNTYIQALLHDTALKYLYINNLNEGRIYYFSIIPFNFDGQNAETFNYLTTPSIPADSAKTVVLPEVITNSNYLDRTDTSMVIKANVRDNGGENLVEWGFAYKEYNAGEPTVSDSVVKETGLFISGDYQDTISDLKSGVRYMYRAYGKNSVGYAYGETYDLYTFSKEPVSVPFYFTATPKSTTSLSISFQSADSIQNCSGFIILSKTGSPIDAILDDGQEYNVNQYIDDAIVVIRINNTNANQLTLNNLSPGTDYHFDIIPYNWNGNDKPTYNYKTDSVVSISVKTIIKPTIVTNQPAQNIDTTSAQLTGQIMDIGADSVIKRGFCFNLAGLGIPDTGNTVLADSGLFGTGSFSKTINNLDPQTSYNYRAFTINNAGLSYGQTYQFLTQSSKPATHPDTFYAVIRSETEVGLYFNALTTIPNANSYIILQNTSAVPAQYPVNKNLYVVGDLIGNSKVAAIVSNQNDTFANIASLVSGNTYYFAIIPYNWNNTHSGSINYLTSGTVKSVMTNLLIGPTVQTVQQVLSRTDTNALIQGIITSTGGENASVRGVCYKVYSSGQPTVNDSLETLNGSFGTESFNMMLDSLQPQTRYQYRAFAENSAGVSYGQTYDFYTYSSEPESYPAFYSEVVSSTQVRLHFSSLSGLNQANGYLMLSKQGKSISALPEDGNAYTLNAPLGDAILIANINDTSRSSLLVSGLQPGATYHFRLIPYNWDNSHELTLNYKTDSITPNDSASLIVVPKVITNSIVTSITDSSVDLSGSITDTGGVSIYTRGFAVRHYDTIVPTINDNIRNEQGNFGNGAYALNMSGLSSGTRYRFRAYAQNQAGTEYGSTYDFFTYSTEPDTNPVQFEATAINQTEIELNISPADNYSDLEGYLILMNLNSQISGNPEDGVAYNVGDILGNSTVVSIISNPTDSLRIFTSLSPANTYYFKAIPFNWDGNNNQTINYYNNLNNPTDTARTVVQPIIYTIDERLDVKPFSTTLKANIFNTGGEPVSVRGFAYKMDTNLAIPTFNDSIQQRSGAFVAGIYTDSISVLQPATEYSYRAFAINSMDTSFGQTYSFHTLSVEPATYPLYLDATTSYTTQIDLQFSPASTISNAIGYLVIQKQGGKPTSSPVDGTAYTVGTTIGDGLIVAIISNQTDTLTSITSISPGNTYFYSLIPYNWDETNAETFNYLTSGNMPYDSALAVLPPEVRINNIHHVNDTIQIEHEITELNGVPSDNIGVAYKEFNITGIPDTSGDKIMLSGIFNKGIRLINIGNLKPATKYKARAFATNSSGTGYSLQAVFHTLSIEPGMHATYFQADASSTSQVDLSFSSLGSISNGNGYLILQSLDSIYTMLPEDGTSYSIGSQLGNATVAAIINDTQLTKTSVTSVLPGMKYYFQLIPFNWDQANSLTINYYTSPVIPRDDAITISKPVVLTTSQIEDISDTRVSVYGNVTTLNGSPTFERGFCYKFHQSPGDPVLTDLVSMESGQFGTGVFSRQLNNLLPGMHYKYRAYATNLAGTSFGGTKDFYTLSREPAIHVQNFQANAFSSTQIDLIFDPLNNYSDVAGYMIIQAPLIQPDILPEDGNAYSIGTILGNGQIVANITDNTRSNISITGLSPNTKYYYYIIPYNWNNQHAETYNYLVNVAISEAFATTKKPCNINSVLIPDGPTTLCQGASVRLIATYDPDYNYSWTLDDELLSYTTNEIVTTKDGEYKVFISNSECNIVSNAVTVDHYPQVKPVIYGSGAIQPCTNDSMQLSTIFYSEYLWSTLDTTREIWVNTSGDYWVEVVDEYGCRIRSENFVVNNSSVSKPEICMVTVYPVLNKNLIIWERERSNRIVKYIVYKETTKANEYVKIGEVDYNEYSYFIDQNSVPGKKSERYRLSIIDTCGFESPLSDPHQTMHLNANQGINNSVNLIWEHYIGYPFSTYEIYRGTDPASLILLDSVQSNLTSYTDVNPPLGIVYYMVRAKRNYTCDPFVVRAATVSGPFSKSLSNLKDFNVAQVEYLNASPMVQNIVVDDSIAIFRVFTNLNNWTAFKEADWINMDADVDNGTITIIASENTTNDSRVAEIIVTGIGVSEVTLKVIQDGRINSINPIHHDVSDVSVFPNPFRDQLTITYSLLKESDVQIELIDMLGKTMDVLIRDRQERGNYEYSFTSSEEWKSGICFIRITVNGRTEIFKVVHVD